MRQRLLIVVCSLAFSHQALRSTDLKELSELALQQPSSPDVWLLLGMALQAAGRQDRSAATDALWCFNRALRSDPSNSAAALQRADLVAQALFWRHREQVWPQLRQLGQLQKLYEVWLEGMAFAPDPQAQLERARVHASSVVRDARHLCGRGSLSTLKVGYASPHFGVDPDTTRQYLPLFHAHDKSRFQLAAFFVAPSFLRPRPQLRQLLAQHAETTDLTRHTDQGAADVIRGAVVHIALDCGGYCQNSRPGVWAEQPSPIQINFPCQLGTLGSEAHSYFVTTQQISTPALASGFMERLTMLPSYHFTEHRTSVLMPENIRSARPSNLVVASLNKPYKFTPSFLHCVMNLFRKNTSLLWWLGLRDLTARENLGAQMAQHGISPQRVHWKKSKLPKEQHIAEIATADAFLDTFEVNAVWTAFDVLWAGVPLFSMPGTKMASRVSASILKSAGGTEGISQSLKEHEDLVSEFGDLNHQ